MKKHSFEHIIEFGSDNELYFYYACKNKLWGVLDIDYQEIIPCRYSLKPELCYFEELFESKASIDQIKMQFPEFYAYKLMFKVKDIQDKFGLYILQKNLLPEFETHINFTKHIYQEININTDKKEVMVMENNHVKTYTFKYFEHHKME